MPRSLLIDAVCIATLCWSSIATAASTDTVIVENAQVRLVFASKPVPFLQELVHKPSGKNMIAEPASQTLFALEVSEPKGGTAVIESRQAKEGSIEVTRVAAGQRILLQFTGLGTVGDIRAKLEGQLGDAEPIVRWSIVVDNPSRQQLSTVRFPCVAAVPAIGSPNDDFIIGPVMPGMVIENPSKNWPANHSLNWSFPYDQSAQFCSYQDRTAGIYVASMDAVGHGRSLRIAKQNNGYVFSHEYRLSDEPVAQWKSPYEVALGVTSGTWQQTADLYKRWAVQQPWCARTLAQRDDIPAAWKQGPCIHTCCVRTYGNESNVCNGSYYPKLLEHLRSLRAKIDGPIVPMLADWENHRGWTAGDYFPIFDEANAKRAIPELHQDGFSPFFFLSGLFYTFDNGGPDGSPVPGSNRYAASFVVDKATGKPKTYILCQGDKGWKRHSYQFCVSAPATREFFRSMIDQTHALGVNIIQMDQTTSGAGDACYSTAHGHTPGPGRYQTQAFHELLGDMRRYGRSLSPQFMLLHEELHEELIPYLDGFHTREYAERWWYRAEPGARGIPLFSYLYHEYALAYGGEGPRASSAKNPHVVWQHAVNLVTGKTPAVSVWSTQSVMAEAHPDQIKMLRNHSHLLKTEAQRFLMLGRMLHPLEFDVPTVTLQIDAQHGNQWRLEPFEERAVLTSSWQSPEGLVGHCLVNITDTKQRVLLQLDTRNAPGWAKANIDLYRADKPDTSERVLQSVVLPHDYTLELVPLEAVFFVIRPAIPIPPKQLTRIGANDYGLTSLH